MNIQKKNSKLIFWTPRILSIILVLFLTIFSWDVFDENLGFWKIALALLIHNIPALLLAAIIWISWKYEIVGGVAFICAGIAHMLFSILRVGVEPWYISAAFSLILDVPAFLIGSLFLVGWNKKKKITRAD